MCSARAAVRLPVRVHPVARPFKVRQVLVPPVAVVLVEAARGRAFLEEARHPEGAVVSAVRVEGRRGPCSI
jgi:hypothetical protein